MSLAYIPFRGDLLGHGSFGEEKIFLPSECWGSPPRYKKHRSQNKKGVKKAVWSGSSLLVRRRGGKWAWEAGAYKNKGGGESIYRRQPLSIKGLWWSLSLSLGQDPESPKRQSSRHLHGKWASLYWWSRKTRLIVGKAIPCAEIGMYKMEKASWVASRIRFIPLASWLGNPAAMTLPTWCTFELWTKIDPFFLNCFCQGGLS